ncbi:MAG: alpha/beta fold hydrolase [Pirellulales bacterium]|nr:alpha/beta fold hydrolase [Pirellulales bacterium]
MRWLPIRCILCLLLVGIMPITFADLGQAGEPERRPASVSPPIDVEVTIPAQDGRIVWKEVAASLAESLSLDAASVERALPHGSWEVRSEYLLLTSLGVNLLSRDRIKIDVVRDEHDQRALRLRCNRNWLKASRLRSQRPIVMMLDEDWAARSRQHPLVVLIHGLRSRPEAFDGLRDYLREAGYATLTVGYDDRQSIASTAQQVSELVKAQIGDHANQNPPLALVGHSLGGLIAREWTEKDELYDRRIVSLITLGSPHLGSHWASMPPLLDLVSKEKFDRHDLVDVLLHQPSDGSLLDLAPGSTQLETMSARPRRPGVAYTTIAGTDSPLNKAQAERIGKMLRSLDSRSKTFHLFQPRLKPLLAGMDEFVSGRGDGAVAVDHAVIEDVNDVVLLDLSHGALIRPAAGRQTNPAWKVVLDRLERLEP